jgi:HEAT repeat protein
VLHGEFEPSHGRSNRWIGRGAPDAIPPKAVHVKSAALVLLLLLSWAAHSADLPASSEMRELLNEAARYQPGQNVEKLRRLEQLVASSASDPAERNQLELGLIGIVTHAETYEARKFACQQLALIGTARAVPALAGLLKSNETVALGCLALGPNPSPEAGRALRGALGVADGEARLQIINTLGNRQDPLAVSILAELGRHREVATAEAAIVALGRIGDSNVVQALSTLRRENRQEVAHALDEASLYCAESLVAAGDRRGASQLYEELLASAQSRAARRGSFHALVSLDEDGGQQRILDVLRGDDAGLKPLAIAGIINLAGADVSHRFGAELPRLAPDDQVLLIEALAARGDPDAIRIIAAQAKSGDASVRTAAVQALGQHGDATSVPALASALADAASAAERQAVERALLTLRGGTTTDAAIIEALKSEADKSKPSLMNALAMRRSRMAVPALLKEAESSVPTVARAAFQALGLLVVSKDLEALLNALTHLKAEAARAHAEIAISRALAELNNKTAGSKLLRARLDATPDLAMRLSLMRLLPNVPDTAALEVLGAASVASDEEVADTALRALADWPDQDAWDLLEGIYRRNGAESYRVLALRGLVRLVRESNRPPDDAIILRYRRLFEGAKTDNDRKLILGALAGVAHPAALEMALSHLDRPGVRAEAALTVRTIAEALSEEHPEAAKAALERLH